MSEPIDPRLRSALMTMQRAAQELREVSAHMSAFLPDGATRDALLQDLLRVRGLAEVLQSATHGYKL
jgi:hypothetical protein